MPPVASPVMIWLEKKTESRSDRQSISNRRRGTPHPDPLPEVEGVPTTSPPDPLPEVEGVATTSHPDPLPEVEGVPTTSSEARGASASPSGRGREERAR